MVDVNITNAITIIVIALLGVALVKWLSRMAGMDLSAWL